VHPQNEIDRLTRPGQAQGVQLKPDFNRVYSTQGPASAVDYSRDGVNITSRHALELPSVDEHAGHQQPSLARQPSTELHALTRPSTGNPKRKSTDMPTIQMSVTPADNNKPKHMLRRADSKRLFKTPAQKASVAELTAAELEDEIDALFNPKGSASLMSPGQSSRPARPSQQQDLAPVQAGTERPKSPSVGSTVGSRFQASFQRSHDDNTQQDETSSTTNIFRNPSRYRADSVVSANAGMRSAASGHTLGMPRMSHHKAKSASLTSTDATYRLDDELAVTYPGWETLKLTDPAKAKRLRDEYVASNVNAPTSG